MHQRINIKQKIRYILIIDKIYVYVYLHFATIRSTAGNKTKFFASLFLTSTSSIFNLVQAFRNDYVAACSTVRHSDTEEIELGGYVSVKKTA